MTVTNLIPSAILLFIIIYMATIYLSSRREFRDMKRRMENHPSASKKEVDRLLSPDWDENSYN